MKKTTLLLFAVSTSLLFYSCQKEVDLQFDTPNNGGGPNPGGGTPNNQSIIGDYTFVGINGSAKTTVAVDNLKTVTIDSYASQNNSGDVKFTSNEFIYTNLAYTINSTSRVQLYMSGLLLGESDYPYDIAPAPISATENYVKNSSDSLTFPNVLFIADNPYSAAVTPAPMGAKISWSKDTLLMKVVHTTSGTLSQAGGPPANFTSLFNGVMKFKKK